MGSEKQARGKRKEKPDARASERGHDQEGPEKGTLVSSTDF